MSNVSCYFEFCGERYNVLPRLPIVFPSSCAELPMDRLSLLEREHFNEVRERVSRFIEDMELDEPGYTCEDFGVFGDFCLSDSDEDLDEL